VVEVVGDRTVRLLTSPQPSQYSFDCVAGETFSQEALFEGQPAETCQTPCATHSRSCSRACATPLPTVQRHALGKWLDASQSLGGRW